MQSDTTEGTGPSIANGPGVGTSAGEAWTRFDDVKGWQMPFKTKGFAASKRINMYAPISIIIGTSTVIVVLRLVTSTSIDMFLIFILVVIILTTVAMIFPLLFMTRQMSEMFENLIREVDLTPDEAIARVESVLVAARMPFTRLSREDPERYWKDEYSETFTIISGGIARVKVYDERPSGMGKATKVYVGPANEENEHLVSTLAWRLDKALPERKPL